MIHLYCVVDHPEAALEGCGRPAPPGTVVVPARGMACVGRECDTTEPPTDDQSLVCHDLVVRRLMRTCTVVPFRYGTVLADADEARHELSRRAEWFEQQLDRLRGRVELALRASTISPPTPIPPSSEGGGRSYLRSLSHHGGMSVLSRLHSTLSGAAVAAVESPERNGALKSSYLVEKEQMVGFSRLVASSVTELGGLRQVSLTGPWAPYSFVTGTPDRPLSGSGRGVGRG